MNNIDFKQFKQDAKGNLIPIANIKPVDLIRDELVMNIVSQGNAVAENIAEFKRKSMNEITHFMQLSADEYNVKWGGKKGNVTLNSFDGSYRVRIAIQEKLTFDERLQVGKQLLDECIASWTEGSNDYVKAIINSAFQIDTEGNLSTARVMGLRKVNIDDPKWLQAMDAIADSLQVQHSKQYIRIYKRNTDGDYDQMNLDIARV